MIEILVLSSSVLFQVITIGVGYQPKSIFDNPSLLRRYEILSNAEHIFRQSPFLGTGLNQFTIHLAHLPPISANYRFLQPLHNMFLLWLTETGVIGTILLTATVYSLFRATTKKHHLSFLPLTFLLIVGTFDHYPLTLQTGQLLLTLSLTLPLLRTQRA